MGLLDYIVVVVVFFTLTDRASTIPSKIRGCQLESGTWSQRGTKVNRSHHGDNPLLRPTGIQIATKSYATLQAMAPTNIKTVTVTRADTTQSWTSMQLTSLFVLRPPGLKKKKARALSPTYAFVLYTFCDPPPPRARASPSLPLSPSCVVCAIANPLYQLSLRASTESIPRCHHHLQVDLNQIAGPLVLRLVSVLSALVSARLLPVNDPVVRHNLRDTPPLV